jgi:hypothetical protein
MELDPPQGSEAQGLAPRCSLKNSTPAANHSETLGSRRSVKTAIPHRHRQVLTRKDERHRQVQRGPLIGSRHS